MFVTGPFLAVEWRVACLQSFSTTLAAKDKTLEGHSYIVKAEIPAPVWEQCFREEYHCLEEGVNETYDRLAELLKKL